MICVLESVSGAVNPLAFQANSGLLVIRLIVSAGNRTQVKRREGLSRKGPAALLQDSLAEVKTTSRSKAKAERAAVTFRKGIEGEGQGRRKALECKEKDGQEEKTIWDSFPRRRPQHKQGSSKCPLVRGSGTARPSCTCSPSLHSSRRGKQKPCFHLWHPHNQMNVAGTKSLHDVV